MAQKLFVGGLSYDTTNESLHRFFAEAGTVVAGRTVAFGDMTLTVMPALGVSMLPLSSTARVLSVAEPGLSGTHV